MKREVGSYGEDNTGAARFDGDDVGLPESPIYSNFSKNLWRTHMRHGPVQSLERSREEHERPQADAGRVVTRLNVSR